MSEDTPQANTVDQVYTEIKGILSEARARAWQAVNSAMVTAYWQVGRVIVEDEQQGVARAEYGRRLLEELSRRLSAEFGRGFDRTNLQQMRNFYLAYPIRDAVRHELT